MCNKDDKRPRDGLDDPDSLGPPVFGRAHRGVAPEDHRGLFFAPLAAALTALVCYRSDGEPETVYDPASGRRRRRPRGLFMILLVVMFLCRDPRPWPRDANGNPEDPAIVSGRRRGLIQLTRTVLARLFPRTA